jgi:hypothetical protein
MCLTSFRSLKDDLFTNLNKINIIITGMTLFSVILAYFDHTGAFVKYYPFRQNALTAFLIFIQIIIFVKSALIDHEIITKLQILILLACLPFIITFGMHTSVSLLKSDFKSSRGPIDELSTFVMEKTQPDDIFMFVHFEQSDKELSFNRKAQRDRFVVFKFIPAGGEKIYDWYQRVLAKRRVEEDINFLIQLKSIYKVDYIVSVKPLDAAKRAYRRNFFNIHTLTVPASNHIGGRHNGHPDIWIRVSAAVFFGVGRDIAALSVADSEIGVHTKMHRRWRYWHPLAAQK